MQWHKASNQPHQNDFTIYMIILTSFNSLPQSTYNICCIIIVYMCVSRNLWLIIVLPMNGLVVNTLLIPAVKIVF